MGDKIFSFLQKLCRFNRNTTYEPDESSTLLPKNTAGQQKSEHSLETRCYVQYNTLNVGDEADNTEISQPGTLKAQSLSFPYHPDPSIPFIKYFMFCINSAFFTLGLAIMSIGFWGLSTKQSLAENIGYLGTDPMLAFVLIGLVTCTLSFSGCVGFIRENTYLLKTFFLGITVLIVAQCLVAIVVLCFQQQIQDFLKTTMLVAMSRYQDDSDLKFIMDEIQLAMECCGVQSYQDWSVNLYFNCTSPGVNSCGVPYSCCIDPLQNGTVPNSQCGFNALGMGEVAASNLIYLGGCIPQLVLWIHSRIWDISAVYFLLIAVELVCIVFAQKVMREIDVVKNLH